MYVYKTKGTCSRAIYIETEGDRVKSVRFEGGCRGNVQGIAKLCAGRTMDEVIELLEGIPCHDGTSCPDQLAKALRQIQKGELV